MALANGVLVHGPTAWAAAVRTDDGDVQVASGIKRIQAARMRYRLLQGPARMAEIVALLPRIRRELPQARFPFERPGVIGAMASGAALVQVLRRSGRVHPVAEELVAAGAALLPAALALRGSELAAYHGAEHVSIGTYEHDEPRPREHERCGTHLVGPLLATSAVATAIAARAPAHLRGPVRAAAQLGAVAASVELFGWMTRNPDRLLARALARPGHEFQSRFATAEPSPRQLEVAEAALTACLALERPQ
jgi:uncharacterized protein YqhQ